MESGRLPIVVIACLPVLLLSGCSLFAPTMEAVTVTATDPAADIFADSMPIGRGAASINLKRNQTHIFMARVNDRTGSAIVGTHLSTTGILDIIGGCLFLFPFLGAIGPGFFSLDQDVVNIYVPPPPTPAAQPAAPAPPPPAPAASQAPPASPQPVPTAPPGPQP